MCRVSVHNRLLVAELIIFIFVVHEPGVPGAPWGLLPFPSSLTSLQVFWGKLPPCWDGERSGVVLPSDG